MYSENSKWFMVALFWYEHFSPPCNTHREQMLLTSHAGFALSVRSFVDHTCLCNWFLAAVSVEVVKASFNDYIFWVLITQKLMTLKYDLFVYPWAYIMIATPCTVFQDLCSLLFGAVCNQTVCLIDWFVWMDFRPFFLNVWLYTDLGKTQQSWHRSDQS